MQSPLVSVIIPTYNRASKVMTAVESVMGQTYPLIQLIVVDDGSVDQTRDLLTQVDGITYVYQKNAGQAAARNTGLKFAKGELIASLDSDDKWAPDFLEKCVQALNQFDVDFVFTNWHQRSKAATDDWEDFFSGYRYLKPFYRGNEKGFVTLNARDLRRLYLQACPSPSSSALIKRSSMVSGWNHRLNIGDDWGMYLDMIMTKPTRAAFTLEKLWYKDIDGQNVFDGRQRIEVVKLLLIDDTKTLLDQYRDKLDTDEKKLLERQYVEGLVELGKHVLIREGKIAKARRLFMEAFSLSAIHSMISLCKLTKTAFEHHYPNIKRRLRIIGQPVAVSKD